MSSISQRHFASENRVCKVRIAYPGHRTGTVLRIVTGLFMILLTALSFIVSLPINPLMQGPGTQQVAGNSQNYTSPFSQSPQLIGADAVPDLSLPKTVVSSVDRLIGAGGVIQTSPQNITLYNSAIMMRLRADSIPRDETVLRNGSAPIPSLYWGVAVQLNGQWTSLLPTSSRLSVIGTNVTGTFVTRTTQLVYGSNTGRLIVVYKALSSGPLKWDLEFTPGVAGHYGLVYDWLNVTSSGQQEVASKNYSVKYGGKNYTFSWADVPASFNVTKTLSPREFSIRIDLGDLVSDLQVKLDPSLVSSSNSADATGFTFQRKIFYDSQEGRYWVFYYDSSVVKYSNSTDGVNWFPPQIYPGCSCSSVVQDSQVSVYVAGRNVLVVQGSGCYTTLDPRTVCIVSLNYELGTVSGPSISWPTKLGHAYYNTVGGCMSGTCAATVEMRYVSGIIASDGNLAISANLYIQVVGGTNSGVCNSSWSTESDVLVSYKGQTFLPDCENASVNLRSMLLSSDSAGGVRLVYQSHVGSSVQLRSRLFYSVGSSKTDAASQSAYIDSSNKDTNYHTSPLYVSQRSGGPTQDTLLGFPSEAMPKDGYLASAQLTLDVVSGTGTYCCQMISSNIGVAWAQSSVNWNVFFSSGPTPLSCPCPFTNTFSSGNLLIDVTSIVNGWYSSPGYGLALQDTGTNDWIVQVEGADSTFFPQLQYTFYCCMTPYDVIDSNTLDGNGLSGVTDTSYGIHILYQGNDGTGVQGNVTYAYRTTETSTWAYNTSIFSNVSSYPILTIDYSTNYLYAFSVQGTSVAMRVKLPVQKWRDSSIVFPITNRNSAPADLGSNFASASGTNANTLLLTWTEGPVSSLYNVWFASIPTETGWSPYATSSDPWDGNGITPYGQYFANMQEYVSPSTGLLTISQSDLSIPGRGMGLVITRVYTEPSSLLGGPYNFESYPWTPLGNGWQLNFPWMSTAQHPAYIHLLNGQGYRIPDSFWTGTPSFMNNVGEYFQMIRNSTGVYLYDKSGVSYTFDPSSQNRLLKITDPTGANKVQFAYYSNNEIANITDTVQRVFQFCYNGALLHSINQTSGTCNNATGSVRGVVYAYNGQSLTKIWDTAGRLTTYSYAATSDPNASPWLVSKVTYPTGWSTNYTYAPFLFGTEAKSYRTHLQLITSNNGTPIREFNYTYTPGPGDQISNSTVISYNSTFTGGIWKMQPTSIASYNFSSAKMFWMTYNGSHQLQGGTEQIFGVHGEITQQTILTTDGANPPKLGSYTDTYSYDQWGNQIYARQVINPSAGWYHESFNAYYNNGFPLGFYAFEENFGRNQGTASNNPWNVKSGSWTVQNYEFSGTDTTGPMEEMMAWTTVGNGDISLQARVYLVKEVNSSDPKVGIFGHYRNDTDSKWSLVLEDKGPSGGTWLSMGDRTAWVSASCTIIYSQWYTFTMTIPRSTTSGLVTATGTVSTTGQPSCSVNQTFSVFNLEGTGPGFGLYAGGFSALFTNVTAITVSSSITSVGFSNSFFNAGAPKPNIHAALAATAQLQNSTGPGLVPIETYYNYWSSGEINQTKSLYNSPSGVQWLTTALNYDSYGNLVQTVDTRGNQTNYSYSPAYKSAFLTGETRILKPGNTPITMAYSYNFTTGTLLSSVDPNGSNTTYRYDILGRQTKVTYVTGDYTAYSYNDNGNYVDVTNEAGWHTRQIYDGLGRLSTTERFLNGKAYSNQTSTLNWQNQASTTTDPMGDVTTYQYDPFGRVVSITKSDGTLVKEYYNDTGSWVLTTDETGVNYRCNIYDRTDRLVSVIEYSDPFCHPRSLAGFFYVTNYYYDEAGNLRTVPGLPFNVLKNPGFENGDFTSWTENGMAIKTDHVHMGLYSAGATSSGNSYQTFTLTQNFTTPIPGSQVTALQFWYYDGDHGTRDRAQVLYSDGSSTQVTLSPCDSCWALLQFSFDNTKSISGIRVLRLSSSGYDIRLDDFLVQTSQTSYNYDNLNRLTSVIHQDGTLETYSYDTNGNIVSSTDQNSVQTTNLYDSLNRLVGVTHHGSTTSTNAYTYDHNGNLLQLRSLNATLGYTYDSRNRVTSESYSINPFDFSVSSSGGFSVTPTGNNLNTISVILVSGTSTQVTLSYAGCPPGATCYFNPTNLGSPTYLESFLVQAHGTTPAGNYTVTVTGMGGGQTHSTQFTVTVLSSGGGSGGGGCSPTNARMAPSVHPCAPLPNQFNSSPASTGSLASSYHFNYTYNGEELQGITYSDNLIVLYTYDGLGRVTAISKQSGPTYALFGYYPSNQVRNVTYGNNFFVSYAYDKLLRPANITLHLCSSTLPPCPSILLSRAYSYYATGDVANVTGGFFGYTSNGVTLNPAPVNEHYMYDPLQRLTNATVTSNGGTTILWYQYDSLGNRILQSVNSTRTGFSYNSLNELTQACTAPSGPACSSVSRYSYDADGRLQAQNVTGTGNNWVYAWSPTETLQQVSNNGVAQGIYGYDGVGRLVESNDGATTKFYAYAGTETLAELSPIGNVTDYIYGSGLRIARLSGSTVDYYHADALGSTLLVTDNNRNIIYSDGYQPYGQDNRTPYCSSSCESYRFTGKPVSQTTGLYYEYQRWYDPSIGRFISQDPFAGHLSDPQSLNPYIYATNQPTGITDPSGMDGCGIFSSVCKLVLSGATTAWNGLTTVGGGIENGWNSLSPEEQQGLMLAGFVALTFATGGTDLLVIGAIGAVAAVGGYLGGTYAAGGTPTLAGALMWANVGFGVTTGVDSLGELGARGGLSVAERLAANRAAGLGYEGEIADTLGLARNIGVGRTVLQGTRTAGSAVPDFVTDSFIGEAKFTQSTVYATRQIRIEIEGAAQAGKAFNIFVPEGTRVADSVFDYGVQFGVKVLKIPFP